jgi:hypothetical protein
MSEGAPEAPVASNGAHRGWTSVDEITGASGYSDSRQPPEIAGKTISFNSNHPHASAAYCCRSDDRPSDVEIGL